MSISHSLCKWVTRIINHKCKTSGTSISNFAWLIYIKNVKLTSKRSKFNWKFNSNVFMSIQGVPVSESAWKVLKFTFHLIKSVAVTQTRTCRFCWFSGELCESAILNFFSYLHCSAILSYCAPSTDTAIIDVLAANQIADILVAMW